MNPFGGGGREGYHGEYLNLALQEVARGTGLKKWDNGWEKKIGSGWGLKVMVQSPVQMWLRWCDQWSLPPTYFHFLRKIITISHALILYISFAIFNINQWIIEDRSIIHLESIFTFGKQALFFHHSLPWNALGFPHYLFTFRFRSWERFLAGSVVRVDGCPVPWA